MKKTTGEVKEIAVNRLSHAYDYNIEENVLIRHGNEAKIEVRHIVDEMVLTMTKDIYGIRKVIEVSKMINIPATWKDHLKKKMGFKYKEEKIEVKIPVDVRAYFPELKGINPTVYYTIRD
jgi:hypothetical protein